MEAYLAATEVIDWQHPEVLNLARRLAKGKEVQQDIVRTCFEWVRDEIKHSFDFKLEAVPCSASETLAAGSGLCYAKSHLLAALLRANGSPAALCYQRLSRDENYDEGGAPFTLHGLNAVYLEDYGWYRLDPRGNRADIHTVFDPPHEALAFKIVSRAECIFPDYFAEPLPVVVEALQKNQKASELWENLPDYGPQD